MPQLTNCPVAGEPSQTPPTLQGLAIRQALLPRQHNTGRFDKHGKPVLPELVVLHWTVGGRTRDDVTLEAYLNKSPHSESYSYGIGRKGTVSRYVLDSDTAWHAGDGGEHRRMWHRPGEPLDTGVRINPASIGVGLCNLGPLDAGDGGLPGSYPRPGFKSWTHFEPYPTAQIAALDSLLAFLVSANPSLHWVCGHEDVTRTKGDPGPLLATWRPPLPLRRIRWVWTTRTYEQKTGNAGEWEVL